MERNSRKVFQGTVVSDKMDKTVVVAVDTFTTDRIYKKRIKKTSKFHVHDEFMMKTIVLKLAMLFASWKLDHFQKLSFIV